MYQRLATPILFYGVGDRLELQFAQPILFARKVLAGLKA
jgi:hypothetical protein